MVAVGVRRLDDGPRVPRRRSLDSIQGLRGIAAALVVLYHLSKAELEFSRSGFSIVRPFLYFGAEGVDLFFVISGFIILWTNLDGFGKVEALSRYAVRRITRIYPLYWVFFAFALLMAIFGFSHTLEAAGGRWNLLDAFFLLPIECTHIVPVSWTLTFEMWFYTFFGFSHCLPRRWFSRLLVVWLLCIVAGYFLSTSQPELHSRASRIADIVLSVRNLEFMGGCVIGLILARRSLPWPGVFFLAGILIFAAGGVRLWQLDPASSASVWRADLILIFGLGSAFMVAGAVGYELTRDARFVPRWLARLGDMSYSLYLSHLFAFAVLRRLVEPLNRPGLPAHLLWLGTLLCGGLLSGWLTYQLIELRMIRTFSALINGARRERTP